jgi:hypothetical protein
MTLLLTCITDGFAVQVSDRLLTYPNGEVAEELANKATLVCNFAASAYTGLARCSAVQATDRLLMRSLSAPGTPISELIETLRVEATKALRQLPLPNLTPQQRRVVRRTSFVGCGFVGMRNPAAFGKQPTPDELHPFMAVVSNAQDLTEVWRPAADREFTAHIDFPDFSHADFVLHVAGQSLLVVERTELMRNIRRCLGRAAHPEPIARLLARAVRLVAQRNPRVGRNVMCTLVRRNDVTAGGGDITRWTDPDRVGVSERSGLLQNA